MLKSLSDSFSSNYSGHPDKWYKVMVWKRLLRRGNKRGKFWIEPVRADMHDDDSRNRITFTFDHSLVIKNITEGDQFDLYNYVFFNLNFSFITKVREHNIS